MEIVLNFSTVALVIDFCCHVYSAVHAVCVIQHTQRVRVFPCLSLYKVCLGTKTLVESRWGDTQHFTHSFYRKAGEPGCVDLL